MMSVFNQCCLVFFQEKDTCEEKEVKDRAENGETGVSQ